MRVGGASCTTGTEVGERQLHGAPAQHTTTVSAGDLSEGANTIRVCVTDAAGNAGSQTTSVVKDTTAPAVTVDSVSDTLIGPSDTGTDVTWHADEDGTYSVRVGGASCTTGNEVDNGSYTGAPAQHVTTVSAGELTEGANTIRVCVADAAGNQGSQTTSVVKDLNPPIVAIDAVSDSLVGPAAPASDITWQASESGTYSVRVGGAGCTTGNVIASGSYGGPPEQTTTTVTVADLSEGANTIRVCVTDAGGSHGSQTTSLVKDTTAPTVAIDAVSDTLIGPDDPSTDVTWHAGENGTYGVRVGGAELHDRNRGGDRRLHGRAGPAHHDRERRRPERGREHDPSLRDRCGRQPGLADDERREGHRGEGDAHLRPPGRRARRGSQPRHRTSGPRRHFASRAAARSTSRAICDSR